jgi:hypothetical protein
MGAVVASVHVTHHLNFNEIHLLLTSPTGGIAKDLIRRGKKVESTAKRNLENAPRRVDTGLLRSSINTQLLTVGGSLVVRVGTNVYYAIWVHNGTGIHGPVGAFIRPKHASVLRWRKHHGNAVFAKRSQGMKPNPFLKKAIIAAKD